MRIEQVITSHKMWINLEDNIDKQEILLGTKDEVIYKMHTSNWIRHQNSLPLDFI